MGDWALLARDAQNKQLLVEAVQEVFDAVGSWRNRSRWLYSMDRLSETLVVDIGAGTIDICPCTAPTPAERIR